MEILRTLLIDFLRWSGWLATVSFFDFAKRSWFEETKKEFFTILGAGLGGVLVSATFLTIFFQLYGVDSLLLIVLTTLWAGNIFWIFGTLVFMTAIEKGVEFVEYYHDWRDSINGPSNRD